MIRIKRVYEKPETGEGFRILIDRLWPRGLPKDRAKVALWLRDIAPSDALRKWFGHDPKKWGQFNRRYRVELQGRAKLLSTLKRLEREHGTITLVYGASDTVHNNAIVLAEMLRRHRWRDEPTCCGSR